MSDIANQQYLLNDQYKNAAKLNTRIQLHERFSTNTMNWQRWVFDQMDIKPGSRILELGCGPGLLWRENLERLPADWDITLSDFSAGMLQEAQHNLHYSKHKFSFKIIDAQSIPFDAQHFDIVIANHMLYHVPDRRKALSEIQRILQPHGRFYAATGGKFHLHEIKELLRRIDNLELWQKGQQQLFTLEQGGEEIGVWFAEVELRRMENALVITEAEPLIAFILSGSAGAVIVGEKLQQLRASINAELEQYGAIRVTKDSGLFIASSPVVTSEVAQ